MSARLKFIGILAFALLGAYWFYVRLDYDTMSIPFFGPVLIDYWYVPVFIITTLAMANAVNITDGLDGLVMGLLLQNYIFYAYITYDQGIFLLSTLCVVIVGAMLAFLWYNIKPAKFYLGDIGSLSLGANLGVMAMMTDTMMVLVIISGIYIFELLSSIIQVISKRVFGRKVFKIAPYHHHLEAIGWSEENIVMRFWLIQLLLTGVAVVVYALIK